MTDYSNIKWPKDLSEEEQIKLNEWLETAEDDDFPALPPAHALIQALFFAASARQMEIGLENIETVCANEIKGLQKTGQKMDRISRLLLISNDGSERFERNVRFLTEGQEGRILVVKIYISSSDFGRALMGRPMNLKAAYVVHKKNVVNILRKAISALT